MFKVSILFRALYAKCPYYPRFCPNVINKITLDLSQLPGGAVIAIEAGLQRLRYINLFSRLFCREMLKDSF